MTLGLGEHAHLLNERKRLGKVAKSEGPFDAPGLVVHLPLWNVDMKVLGLLRVRGGIPPLQGVHFFRSERVDHTHSPSPN